MIEIKSLLTLFVTNHLFVNGKERSSWHALLGQCRQRALQHQTKLRNFFGCAYPDRAVQTLLDDKLLISPVQLKEGDVKVPSFPVMPRNVGMYRPTDIAFSINCSVDGDGELQNMKASYACIYTYVFMTYSCMIFRHV